MSTEQIGAAHHEPADISKSPDRIAGMFDAIADRYDFLNHLLSAGIDTRWRRRAIASLRLTGSERVLDLCTGTGDVAIASVRLPRGGARRVVGVDFAGAMLRIAATKVQRAGLASSIAIVRGDATRVPVADRSIDAATIAFGIRNVDDVTAAARELHRVLRPGGRFAILEFAIPTAPLVRAVYLAYFAHVLPRIGRIVSRHNRAYAYLPESVGAFATPDEFVTILRQAGFTGIAAVPLTFGIVFLYTGTA
jgi:demethylmenaquinone methyltransferase / 2-methoxy-6-polyprenyl-1,4-benzoquinol methylase